METKDLILNLAQGPPREDIVTTSPHERHSPVQTSSTRTPQKYPQQRSGMQTNMITPPTASVPEDEYSDSNGAVGYSQPEYSVFLSNFNEETYYHHEIFYPYADHEVSQHNLNPLNPTPQQRPYSASSSSCSSVESEHATQSFHLQNLSNGYCPETMHNQHFSINCFNNNQSHSQTQQNLYGHEFNKLPHPQTSAGYTSVIVEAQQYQLTNEYVH